MGRLSGDAAGFAAARSRLRTTAKTAPATTRRRRTQYTLYGSRRSGPTYKVALLLSLARRPFDYVEVAMSEGEHKTQQYLVKNRYGQVPCLRDANLYLCQSAAILEHVAETTHRYNGRTSGEVARTREWMFWDFDKLAPAIYGLRARNLGVRQFGDEVAGYFTAGAEASFALLDRILAPIDWLASRRATIADIDVYGVVRYAPEAGFDLAAYPHVVAWMERLEGLPGFGHPEDILPRDDRLG